MVILFCKIRRSQKWQGKIQSTWLYKVPMIILIIGIILNRGFEMVATKFSSAWSAVVMMIMVALLEGFIWWNDAAGFFGPIITITSPLLAMITSESLTRTWKPKWVQNINLLSYFTNLCQIKNLRFYYWQHYFLLIKQSILKNYFLYIY